MESVVKFHEACVDLCSSIRYISLTIGSLFYMWVFSILTSEANRLMFGSEGIVQLRLEDMVVD